MCIAARAGDTAAEMQDEMAERAGHGEGRVQKRAEGGLVGVPTYDQVRNAEYKMKKTYRSKGVSQYDMIHGLLT